MTIETFKKAEILYDTICELEQQTEKIEKMLKELSEDKYLELKLVECESVFREITVGANTAKNILELLKRDNKKALQAVKQEFQEL